MKKDIKRYYKFRNNNLPTPYRNKDREVLEYVTSRSKDIKSYNDIEISDSLEYSLSRLAYTGLYYPYTCVLVNYKDGLYHPEVGHSHGHNFEEVLQDLYRFPESFNIEQEDKKYYSGQELWYLNQIKKYLLFIGLKDSPMGKDKISRYRSKRREKYGDIQINRMSGKLLKDILAGKANYLLITYYGDKFEDKVFKPGEYKELITDQDDNYLLFVEVTKVVCDDINKYKEYIDMSKVSPECKYVCVSYINILERFDS